MISILGPYFCVFREKNKIFQSHVYEGAKKGEPEFIMSLPRPLAVCGDIMIQFFHKQKMAKKVGATVIVMLFVCECE